MAVLTMDEQPVTIRDVVNFLCDTLEITRAKAITIFKAAQAEGYFQCDCGKGEWCPQYGRSFYAIT